jgi:predicted methyltransferase
MKERALMRSPCRSFGTLVIAGLVALSPASLGAQSDAADAKRLVEHLQLRPGMTVAEIGAGAGRLTVEIARVVGPDGHVYSNELDTARHGAIRAAAERAGLANVTVVEGRAADANLSEACCDAIFMRDVYHHFTEPGPMTASLWRALKPGGRIAIIDFPPRTGRGSHGTEPAAVEGGLREAGFEILGTESQRDGRWFMVVATKPGDAGPQTRKHVRFGHLGSAPHRQGTA